MPLYSYKCGICDNKREEIRSIKGRNFPRPCGKCNYGLIHRDMASENKVFFDDIKPYFDLSLGEQVNGRRDKQTKYRNAGMIMVAGHHGGDVTRPEKRLYGDEQYHKEVIEGDKPGDYQKRVEDLMEA